ncbi:phage tail protein [Salmonella enterica subsp. enterica serovar Infantis]|nr:phage tail protein [Salmonella enterica]EDC6980809.1 phage tail protein [Salmonella enterica subsp. enterica serovar Infantis]EDF6627099.1 phage tail protein [Salmonella enterica subsp. enterica serovar Infantis]EDG4845208.1 phage tail protein [Salmonella enterica subsp. enterica serovar Infantis]EDG5887249.1 phage tail protein [Salmonella enterica subsp. enterica serovar Infantis]
MPQLKGVIKTPTGEPLGGATITLTSLHNRAGILKSVFSHVTTQNGEYDFPVLPGVYSVRLTQSTQRLSEIGVIRVYEDSTDGSLNDFLGATDIDLRPEALKKFEELAQQAQQSAEKAGEHATAAEQARQDTETLAGEIQQDAEEIAGNVQKAEKLASETNQNAARAEQAVKDADKIVQKAVDKLADAATLTGEAKASAESAAKSEQNAKQHRDEAQRIVDELKGTNASTTQKGLVQLCSDTDNDSEELAATPKAVKTVMDETKTKAPLDSPAFTGTPTTPTPPDDAVGLETANAAFVRKLLAALVDSSPEALDTLNELAAALGNDPNFSTTVINALAGKQPLSDVLTAISNLEERADNLLCFNQDGNASLSPLSEKARALLVLDTPEAMRTELELKAAATMEAQSDIYDRTAGCLALPGAFGYGHLFSSSEVVYFSAQNGPAEFLKWVFEVTPGRYAVTQSEESSTSYNPIIAYDMGQPYFRGLVDIDIRYGINSGGIEAEARRWITFHGDAEYSGGFGEGPAKYQVLVKKSMRPSDLPKAWSRLFWSRKRLMQLLYATENTSKRPPLPGGLVLAAYLPDDGSSEVTLLRAQGVSGSRLRQVVFEAEYRTSGFSAAARSFVYEGTLPGTYVALSGGPDVKFYNRGLVSLFVRIA